MTVLIHGHEAPINTLPFDTYGGLEVHPTKAIVSTDAPLAIPKEVVYELEEGERGAEVFGLQQGLNTIGWNLSADGIFGVQTREAVKVFQDKRGLHPDGVFGAQSSTKLAYALAKRTEQTTPIGLIRSVVEGESGNLVGAVNWSVPGGVDCSFCQRRVYSDKYDDAATVKRAFDGKYQMQLLANNIRFHHDDYLGEPGAQTHELAWRLGTLYHNYPYAANKIAEVGIKGLSSYWTTEQDWVLAINAHFDDGDLVTTPLGWCKFYSLGAPGHNHKGKMVKYVTSWE